jgi:hypothetical protein
MVSGLESYRAAPTNSLAVIVPDAEPVPDGTLKVKVLALGTERIVFVPLYADGDAPEIKTLSLTANPCAVDVAVAVPPASVMEDSVLDTAVLAVYAIEIPENESPLFILYR